MQNTYTPAKVIFGIAGFINRQSAEAVVLEVLSESVDSGGPCIDMQGGPAIDIEVKQITRHRVAEFDFPGIDSCYAAEFGSSLASKPNITGVTILDGSAFDPCIRTFGYVSTQDEQKAVTEYLHQEIVRNATRALIAAQNTVL